MSRHCRIDGLRIIFGSGAHLEWTVRNDHLYESQNVTWCCLQVRSSLVSTLPLRNASSWFSIYQHVTCLFNVRMEGIWSFGYYHRYLNNDQCLLCTSPCFHSFLFFDVRLFFPSHFYFTFFSRNFCHIFISRPSIVPLVDLQLLRTKTLQSEVICYCFLFNKVDRRATWAVC